MRSARRVQSVAVVGDDRRHECARRDLRSRWATCRPRCAPARRRVLGGRDSAPPEATGPSVRRPLARGVLESGQAAKRITGASDARRGAVVAGRDLRQPLRARGQPAARQSPRSSARRTITVRCWPAAPPAHGSRPARADPPRAHAQAPDQPSQQSPNICSVVYQKDSREVCREVCRYAGTFTPTPPTRRRERQTRPLPVDSSKRSEGRRRQRAERPPSADPTKSLRDQVPIGIEIAKRATPSRRADDGPRSWSKAIGGRCRAGSRSNWTQEQEVHRAGPPP